MGNLVQALEALKARGVWVVGFDAAGTERWDAVDLARPVALVLGGEGRGIRRLVREHCDHLVSIPHFGHVGSLNVSVAAGIALYEAVRQRRAVPSVVRPIPARPAQAPRIVGPAPDDAETDPGARPLPPWPSTSSTGRATTRRCPSTHVDPHEDVAWGQGPTVLKPAGFERVRRNDGGRGRKRRRPPSGGDRGFGGRPRSASPADAAAPPGPAHRHKGRRRRRGRRDEASPPVGAASARARARAAGAGRHPPAGRRPGRSARAGRAPARRARPPPSTPSSTLSRTGRREVGTPLARPRPLCYTHRLSLA